MVSPARQASNSTRSPGGVDGTATITVPLTPRYGRTAPAHLRVRASLPWFLGLSALIHGVLIGWLWWPTEVPVRTPGGETLALTLQTVRPAPSKPKPAAATPPPSPVPARQATHTTKPAMAPRATASPAAPKHETDAVAATTAPAMPAAIAPATESRTPAAAAPSAAQQRAQAEAKVSASLRQALRAHFSYPLLARRRGWAGRVQLSLRVESDGRLSHVRLLESSGYGLLDRAALASVRAIGVVPQALRWLHGHHFDIVLPVEYRLLDS